MSTGRKGPDDSATEYRIGHVMIGNDGNEWEVIKTSNGIKRWKRIKNPAAGIDPEILKEFEEYQGDSKHTHPQYYKKALDEMIEYQSLKNKIEFVPLSLEIAAKNIGKKIYYYYANGENPNGPCGPTGVPRIKDRNNRKKVFGEYLILNGDLHHYPNGPRGGKPHVYPGWLKNQDSFKIKKGMFLYLAGYLSIVGEGASQLGDPFSHGKFKGTRILSDNTINGEDWVEKGIYAGSPA